MIIRIRYSTVLESNDFLCFLFINYLWFEKYKEFRAVLVMFLTFSWHQNAMIHPQTDTREMQAQFDLYLNFFQFKILMKPVKQ